MDVHNSILDEDPDKVGVAASTPSRDPDGIGGVSTTIAVDGVGPVLFERSKRARRLSISVRPFRGVRVAVPLGLSLKKAEAFAHAKSRWIRKHLGRMKRVEQKYEATRPDAIWVDIVASSAQGIGRVAAGKKLINRLNELAGKHDFSCNKVSVRNQRTRWGSCSPGNNISLNVKLAWLPDELIDYVILHELVHTRVRNHSKDFWAMLDGLVTHAKRMDSRLKEYTPIPPSPPSRDPDGIGGVSTYGVGTSGTSI